LSRPSIFEEKRGRRRRGGKEKGGGGKKEEKNDGEKKISPLDFMASSATALKPVFVLTRGRNHHCRLQMKSSATKIICSFPFFEGIPKAFSYENTIKALAN